MLSAIIEEHEKIGGQIMQNTRSNNLKMAEKGVWVSIFAYIILSIGQIVVAQLTHSSALKANGFNNLTDILGNIAILIGLRIARIPADNDHVYGHWKIESIASLVSSFIMFFVGFEVLRDTILNILSNKKEIIDPLGAIVALISAFIMIAVYFYTNRLAKKTQSQALLAASKDNLSDALTSIGTAVAILASIIHLAWLDKIMALIISGFILKTAYDIFKDSVFSLSDGFDENLIEQYTDAVAKAPKVQNVKLVRGRTYGSNIFLDVVVEMSPDLSVFESHAATESIEKMLRDEFDVYDVDVHVEPAILPEVEHFSSRSLELLAQEEEILNQQNLEQLLAPNYEEVGINGHVINRDEKLSALTDKNLAIKSYQAQQVSKKTFILTYQFFEGNQNVTVSSIWRRNNSWYCLFRQLTPQTHKNEKSD
ncbi:cation transporter [Lactococcus fujiensis JCM 16395]|uniref:Cation transporter n=2 Tax=Lactococcus fujiensis TaxID=610251 RepID=A0A2A5RMU1_9LACT|nr:cation transporter [Lactococcus fujiensis JCM 16395]